jgi:PPM family protein phosphatase
MAIEVGWATATGPRPDNQDRCVVGAGWLVLSDGAGGIRGGGRAAGLAVGAAAGRLAASRAVGPVDEETVRAAMAAADAAVRTGQATHPDEASMAATLTLAAAAGGDRWLVAGIGDSPAWLVTARRITRVTDDDNAAAELVRAGVISADEARTHPGRHWITRALGATTGPGGGAELDVTPVALGPGEALVLASDGLAPVPVQAIALAARSAASADDAARWLVDAAVAARTTDNVTVAVARETGRR